MTKQSARLILEAVTTVLTHSLTMDFPWNTVSTYFKSSSLSLNFLQSLLILALDHFYIEINKHQSSDTSGKQ